MTDKEERWHAGVAGIVSTTAMNLTEMNMLKVASASVWGGVGGLLVFRARKYVEDYHNTKQQHGVPLAASGVPKAP